MMLSVPAVEGVMLDVLSLREWLPATGWCISCQWRFMRVMLALCSHLQNLHPAVNHLPDGVLLIQLKYDVISVQTARAAGPCMVAGG